MISPTPGVKSKIIKPHQRAFTLLELVIVVVIMGLIYGMVSLNMNKATTSLPKLSAKNLASFLTSLDDAPKRSFYLYGEKCQYVAFDPELPQDVTLNDIAFHPQTQAFWFDSFGSMQALEFAPLKLEHFTTPVCLKYEQFSNGSHTPLVIQSGKTFYYHSFFEGTRSFSSLQEAASWIRHTSSNPKDLGLHP